MEDHFDGEAFYHQVVIAPLFEQVEAVNKPLHLRCEAIKILGEFEDAPVQKYLIELLKHPDVRFRLQAVKSLIGKNQSPLSEILLELLQSDDHTVRGDAAKILGEIREPRAFKPLLNLLTDTNTWVRVQAVEALAKFKNQKVLPALQMLYQIETAKPDYSIKLVETINIAIKSFA
jgi:HEAT repeat protein